MGAPVCWAGGVVVSPARIVQTVREGEWLPPITVRNDTDRAVKMVIYVGRGLHSLDGTPVYLDSPQEREWGRRHLHLDKERVTLAAGEAASVRAKVTNLDDVEGGLYPVIFLEMEPIMGKEGTRGISRLAVLTLLTRQGNHPLPAVEVATLQVSQTGPGESIGVFPTVTNKGTVHVSTSGYIEITDAREDTVARLPVRPTTVLPGCSRKLHIWWRPQSLPVGRYHVRTQLMAAGRPVPSASWAFQVTRPYELAAIRGKLVSWQPVKAAAGTGISFRGLIHNTGNVPWTATGTVVVQNRSGSVEAEIPVELKNIKPGGTSPISGHIPPLVPGDYTVHLRLRTPGTGESCVLEAVCPLEVVQMGTVARR